MKNTKTKDLPVKFAIIGYGLIGERYEQRLSENPDSLLVAVAEIKPSRLNKIKTIGVDKFKDYKQLLKSTNADVIVVAVPNYLHYLVSIDSLRAGKHVICEKPMTLSSKQAVKMMAEEKKSGKKLMIVKQNRYNPPVKKIKDLVNNGKLGKVGLIVVNCIWNRNDAYYLKSDWKGKLKLDGGTLYTQFSHFIDIVYYLFGPFSKVLVKRLNLTHKKTIEFEDTGVVMFELKNGALGSINYSTSALNKNVEGSISVVAENGTFKIGGQYLNTLEYYDIKGIKSIILEKGNLPNNYGYYQGSMSNHNFVVENAVEVARGKGKVATSSFEGAEIVKAIESMYKSASTGKWVKI